MQQRVRALDAVQRRQRLGPAEERARARLSGGKVYGAEAAGARSALRRAMLAWRPERPPQAESLPHKNAKLQGARSALNRTRQKRIGRSIPARQLKIYLDRYMLSGVY